MFKYLRQDIRNLKSYVVNEDDYEIKLDANEGIDWIGGKNRYPNDTCSELRRRLAKKLDKNPNEFLFGNGSSELIELVMKAYLEYGEKVLAISPAFSMYRLYTIINKGLYKEYPLDNLMDLNVDGFINFIRQEKPKIIILCNPNNPTGTIINRQDILRIVKASDCMVILDEAYIEFSDLEIEDDTREYKNLIVLRTFSKAYGLAAIRLGYMIGDCETIEYINRVRSPYNINAMTQEIALRALEEDNLLEDNINMIKSQRERVRKGLEDLGLETFPSQANFIFFKGYKNLASDLAKKKILIRDYGGDLEGYFRLTIASPDENGKALKAIKEVLNEKGDN
ncbi:MAG: histidinol-phosphate transaminase [Tissierellia bacterium]|nr:histidinol-phosphate transaminase [Tissierellia bacterium]